jgi:hypothetical protein
MPIASPVSAAALAAADSLACQNGAIAGVMRFDPQPRHVRNGRDLAKFVHRDFSFQAALDACLVLLKIGAPPNGAPRLACL